MSHKAQLSVIAYALSIGIYLSTCLDRITKQAYRNIEINLVIPRFTGNTDKESIMKEQRERIPGVQLELIKYNMRNAG